MRHGPTHFPDYEPHPSHDSDSATASAGYNAAACKSVQRTIIGPLLSAEEAPAPTAGHRRSAPAANFRGLTRKSCTCKGRPPSYEVPQCGTAKRRPEHGTKPDFDIRLIPPYADDHSSCMALAPSWTSRIAAYGPGPSVW